MEKREFLNYDCIEAARSLKVQEKAWAEDDLLFKEAQKRKEQTILTGYRYMELSLTFIVCGIWSAVIVEQSPLEVLRENRLYAFYSIVVLLMFLFGYFIARVFGPRV